MPRITLGEVIGALRGAETDAQDQVKADMANDTGKTQKEKDGFIKLQQYQIQQQYDQLVTQALEGKVKNDKEIGQVISRD